MRLERACCISRVRRSMKVWLISLPALLTLAVPTAICSAHSQWKSFQITDRMSDKVFYFAGVLAKEVSDGVEGRLDIGCAEGTRPTESDFLYVAIQLSEDMPSGALIAWRVDDGPTQFQPMPNVRSTSRSALHKLKPDSLKSAKRVRVQWTHWSGERRPLLYEFDVAGADAAITGIPCSKARKR